MKKSIAILILLSVLIFGAGNASAARGDSVNFNTTGAEWKKWCAESTFACQFYIRGMLDAYLLINSMDRVVIVENGTTIEYKPFCLPIGTTVAVVAAFVKMHMERKPSMLKERLDVNLMQILRAEFPCEKKKETKRPKTFNPKWQS